jgi:5'(3')-deoxyribonucleotidase
MRTPEFISDVDGCTADLVGGLRKYINERFGFDFDPSEVVYHNSMGRSPGLADLNEELARWFPGDEDGDNRGFGGAFTQFMRDPNVYMKWIDPIPGSVDAIAEIRQKYKVVFCTALMKGARDHFRSKMEWIERWFPNIPIVTCPSGEKYMFRGDWAVDDRYDTCARWITAGTPALLFRQSWNEIPEGVKTVTHDWKSVLEAVMR